MEITNIYNELKNTPIDTKANIRIVKLTGDDSLSIFAAQVLPMNSLNPHYHKNGIETYQIYSGNGIMKTGTIEGIAVQWTGLHKVTKGDFFSISANTVHQIVNNTEDPLILIFSCPAGHLNSDRFFIQKEV